MLGAGAAVAGFAVISVNAALDAQEANLKLQNTFENNAKLSDSSVAAFQRQADALRELTGVDDEAIITAQALLGQFELTGAQVQELTPLIVDLSSKMGIDLQSAAKAVGKATQGSTGILSRYGIILDEAAVQTDAFAAVTDGLSGTVGGFAKQLADQQPWRVFISEIEEVAEQFGKALLPFLKSGTQLLRHLIPVLELAANNMGLIVAALAGFAAVRFVPPLLLAIAAGLERVGFAALANNVLNLSIAFQALGRAIPLVGLAAVPVLFSEIVRAIDPVEPEMIALNERMKEFGVVRGPAMEQAATRLADKLAGDQEAMAAKAGLAEQGILNLGGATAKTANDLQKSGQDVDRLGHRLRELRTAVVQSVEDQVGSLDGLRNKWDLTTHAAIEDMRSMVKMAQEMARDFKQLDRQAIPEKFQEWLLQQGPAAVHAFVNGTVQQKDRWVSLWREMEGATTRAIAGARNAAVAGGREIGTSLVAGLRNTIQQYTGTVSAQAAFMVRDAIAAARAAAGAKSPSKEMIKLGQDMAVGLIEGFASQQEKVVEKWQEMLERILGLARSFRDSIRGGFGSLLDISGAFGTEEAPVTPESIADFFKSQRRTAAQFADVLEALRRQGASKRLLSDIGAAGPEAIPFAQGLLQGGPQLIRDVSNSLQRIAHIAGDVSEQLTNSFFGQKIDEVRDQLRQENEKLGNVNHLLRQIEAQDRKNVTINITGWVGSDSELAQKIRNELNKLGSRNAGAGIR